MSSQYRSSKALAVACVAILFLTLVSGVLRSETIEVDGEVYLNAEMVEVCRAGAIYHVNGGEYVTLPWEKLNPVQLTTAKSKFREGMQNALFSACYVEGSIFEVKPNGVVVQIRAREEYDGPGFEKGAKLLKGGMAFIEDLPSNIPRQEGAEVKVIANQIKTFTFDFGALGASEYPYLTVAPPKWAQEQEWKNTDGQIMRAKLLAVKDGKGMFERSGQRFVYELNKLDKESLGRAELVAKKLEGFPLP